MIKIRKLNIDTLKKDTIVELKHAIITGSKIELNISESENGKLEVLVQSTNGRMDRVNITLNSGNVFEISLDDSYNEVN